MHASRQPWSLVVPSVLLLLSPAGCSPAPVSTISSRSTTSEVVHDKFFIPALAAMGSLLLIALLCCYMIIRGGRGKESDHSRGVTWAPVTPVVGGAYAHGNPPGSPLRSDGVPESPSTLGRRVSKVQRKPAPPLGAGPPNSPPLAPGPGMVSPFGERPSYTTYQPPSQVLASHQRTDQARAIVGPQNPSGMTPSAQNPPPAAMSVLSSGQSSTQVGSDAGSPKTKPYSAVGGYGFSSQPQTSPQPHNGEFGTQQADRTSQPSTYASNYNPYEGIDPAYSGTHGLVTGQGPSMSPQQTSPVYYDPYHAGAQYYDAQKRPT